MPDPEDDGDHPPPPPGIITGDGALLPRPFHGSSLENAEVWLTYLDR